MGLPAAHQYQGEGIPLTGSTEALAILSGLAPDWARQFSASKQLGMSIVRTDASNSDNSVADTVALMGSHANAGSVSPQVIKALNDAGVRASDTEDKKIQKVYLYIKGHVRFVEDETQLKNIFAVPNSKELLITPPVLLSMSQPKGDCDDFSMVGCSMLMAAGVQCDFTTIAAEVDMPDQFTHVYCMVKTNDGRSIPFDTSHGKAVGWESPRIFRKMVWPVFSWNKGKGLGMTLRERAGLTGGLGDFAEDLSSMENSSVISAGGDYTYSDANYPTYNPPSGPSIWNSILPGIFNAGEKIAVQTTQQPGIQTVGPNGQYSSTVLPAGASSLNIPGLTSGGINPLFLLGGITLLVLFAMKK